MSKQYKFMKSSERYNQTAAKLVWCSLTWMLRSIL